MSASEPTPPASTPRRFRWQRLVQYRLRTLVILTTVIAVWLGWWSHTARRQRAAVAAIKEAKGRVWYDFQVRQLKQPPNCPFWLVHALGVDYFASVEHLCIDITDDRLGDIKCLTTVKWLVLTNTPVTDTILERLKGFTVLQGLCLDGTQVTDVGLEHLTGLAELRTLDLRSTKVTDAGVDRLQKSLPNCKIVYGPR